MDKELEEMEKKAKKSMEEHKVDHPCPFCGQELPGGEDFVVTAKKVTLNLTDANTLASTKAKEERMANKYERAQTELTERIYIIAEEKEFFNNSPGINTERGVLTWVDANGERQDSDIKVDESVCKGLKIDVHKLNRLGNAFKLAQVGRRELMTELAVRYKWTQFPFDIRNGQFTDISDEVRRQRELNMQQLEQQMSKPRLKDEKAVEAE